MDEILENVGPFGRYQKLILALAGLVSSMTASVVYSTVFTAASPRLICSNLASLNDSSNNKTSEPSSCQAWTDLKSNQNSSYECRFDTKHYDSTLVTELGLVCDKTWMASLTTTMYLAGTISGLFLGYFSDRYGRKKSALALSIIISAVLSLWLIVPFELVDLDDSSKYVLFCILQFICGATGKSLYMVSYILVFELTTTKYKTLVTNVFSYVYITGEIFLLLVAFIAPDWKIIMLFLAVFSIITVFLVAFLMPESPRFLMSKSHHNAKLQSLLKKIARINGKVCDEKILEKEIELETKQQQSAETTSQNDEETKQEVKILFKKENLLKIALFIYIWFTLSLCYYGVSLGK